MRFRSSLPCSMRVVCTCLVLASTAGSAAALRTNSGTDFLAQASSALLEPLLGERHASMQCVEHIHLKTLIHCALPGCPDVVLL